MRLARLDGEPFPLFLEQDGEVDCRIKGRWMSRDDLQPATEEDAAAVKSLRDLLLALPGWDLIEGLDLAQFTPMPHQLLAADALASPWLADVLGEEAYLQGRKRTRLLIADEGGTGKTLTASIAARWFDTRMRQRSGPILVLVPPLLIDEWLNHLRAAFHDDVGRVKELSSARWYDGRLDAGNVLVVSKYSWAKHLKNGNTQRQLRENPPSMLIIDEVHQGRSRFRSNEEEDTDGVHAQLDEWGEDGLGAAGAAGTMAGEVDGGTLLNAQSSTAARAEVVLGLSATPINLEVSELRGILSMMHAEQALQGGHLPCQQRSEEGKAWDEKWLQELVRLRRDARHRLAEDCLDGGELQTLINLLDNRPEGAVTAPEGPGRTWRNLPEEAREQILPMLEQARDRPGGLSPPTVLRLCRELHPYGRHFLLTSRKDLLRDDDAETAQFRTRCDETRRFPDPLATDPLAQATFMLNELNAHRKRLLRSSRWNPLQNATVQGGGVGPPRYGDVDSWMLGTQLYSTAQMNELDDPRVTALVDLINADLARDDEEMDPATNRLKARGMVIFTEYKGTVDALVQREKRRIGSQLPEGVKLDVHALTGETPRKGPGGARGILNQCEKNSRHPNRYPVIVCTSAGEVGLNMAWATTLVHWDLHPTPQKLEQRTWRLDRRLRADGMNRTTYTVVSFQHDDALTADRIAAIETRYRSAVTELALDGHDEDYFPDEGAVRQRIPGGASCAMSLKEEELCDLLEHATTGGAAMANARLQWARGSERLHGFLRQRMIMGQDAPESLLQEGRWDLEADQEQGLLEGGDGLGGVFHTKQRFDPLWGSRAWPGPSIEPQGYRLHLALHADREATWPEDRRLAPARPGLQRVLSAALSIDPGGGRCPLVVLEEDGEDHVQR